MTIDDFLRLDGSTILVTGASSGIGRACAIEASRYGAKIALVGRREDALQETRSLLSGEGHVVAPFDLADLDGIPAFVGTVSAGLGGLDGIVHAAGRHDTAPVRTISASAVTALFDVNVTTAMMLAKGFRAKQVRREGASLVLLASAVGLVGQAGVSAYSASKGAIVTLTKSLALELARDDIRVNCVCPGIVETPMTEGIRSQVGVVAFERIAAAHPLGLGEPLDVANAVLYLLSGASRWVTGSALVVDGGYTAQ